VLDDIEVLGGREGWEAGKLGSREAGRQGSWEAGKLGSREAGKLEGWNT